MSKNSKPLAPMDLLHRESVCARVGLHNGYSFAAGVVSTISPISEALPAFECAMRRQLTSMILSIALSQYLGTKRNMSAFNVTIGSVMATDKITAPYFSKTDGSKLQMASIPGHVAPERKTNENTSSLPEIFLMSFPMVATNDIGQLGAATLQQEWKGNRFLELEGPQRYPPLDAAAAFSRLLSRPVSAKPIPRDEWNVSLNNKVCPKAAQCPGSRCLMDSTPGGLILSELVRGHSKEV
jgi:hypothetical protein